jgi:hypothetical protein
MQLRRPSLRPNNNYKKNRPSLRCAAHFIADGAANDFTRGR